jgi:PST family polysaccharide transporter
MVIRLVGVVLIVRKIGPSPYGIYSGAAAFVLFVASFAQMGSEVYLIKLPGEVEARHYNQAFSFLICTSIAATAISEALTFALGGLLRPIGVLLPLRILLLSIPANVLWAPSQAAIERRFGYRQMGLLELGGDVALYATAVPLAFLGFKAWSLVAGYFAWQTWLLVASWATSGLRLRWDWSLAACRDMARHGLGYSTAQWVTRLASLVNPLVVGTFLGAAGVGYVAFAQRLVDTVAFAQRGAYRLGMVAMSRVSNEEESRLRYSVEEGSRLQLLALGVPLACFGLAAHWVVPAIFGHQWLRAVPLYGLLALFAMLNASGLIQMTFLYSRGRNMAVTGAASIQVVVLAVSSIFLVKRMGINGFGVASLLALVDLIYMDRMVRKFFAFSYKRILPWVVILAPPVLFPLVEPPWGFLLLAPIVLVLLPGMRVEIKRIFDLIRSSLARPRPLSEAPAVVGRAP